MKWRLAVRKRLHWRPFHSHSAFPHTAHDMGCCNSSTPGVVYTMLVCSIPQDTRTKKLLTRKRAAMPLTITDIMTTASTVWPILLGRGLPFGLKTDHFQLRITHSFPVWTWESMRCGKFRNICYCSLHNGRTGGVRCNKVSFFLQEQRQAERRNSLAFHGKCEAQRWHITCLDGSDKERAR